MTKPHASATSIHRGAYVKATDPGAVGQQKLWVDTSVGPPYELKVRSDDNTSWVAIGSIGAMSNPMTTLYDVIVAAADGDPGRLGVGAGRDLFWVEPGVGPAWGSPLDMWNGTDDGQLLSVHDGIAEFVGPVIADATHEGGVRITGTPSDAAHPTVPVIQAGGKIPSSTYDAGGDVANGGNAYASPMAVGTLDDNDFAIIRNADQALIVGATQIQLNRYLWLDLSVSAGYHYAGDVEIDIDDDIPGLSYAFGGSSIVLPGASTVVRSIGVYGNSSFAHNSPAGVSDLVGVAGDLYFGGTDDTGGSVARAIALYGYAVNGAGTTPIDKAVAVYGELNTKGTENWSGYFEGDVNTNTGYFVGGLQVISAQAINVADVAHADAPAAALLYTQADVQNMVDLLNETKAQLNAMAAMLRGHGLMA